MENKNTCSLYHEKIIDKTVPLYADEKINIIKEWAHWNEEFDITIVNGIEKFMLRNGYVTPQQENVLDIVIEKFKDGKF